MSTPGTRVYPDENGKFSMPESSYGQDAEGNWYARPPGNHMGSLEQHEVTEHEDGTITVSPSILINDGRNEWHGYLRRGVFEEC